MIRHLSVKHVWRMARRGAFAALLFAGLGCGVVIGADRAAIGGGPEQATTVARTNIQATAVAIATARAASGQTDAYPPCDCDSYGK